MGCRFQEIQSDEHPPVAFSLAEDLVIFSILFNIPRKGLQHLLDILVRHKVDVPKTVYLLRKACNSFDLTQFRKDNEQFAYIGLQENITYALANNLLTSQVSSSPKFINIQINIDGLPLFRSFSLNLWPILIKLSGLHCPLPVAVFCGEGKPKLTCILEKLTEELKALINEGFFYADMHVFVKNVVFVCDAPVRSFLQCVKSHTGYFGCRQKGEYVDGRVVFPLTASCLRTDSEYLLFNENNQVSVSPLSGIVPMFSAFPPEYMHLVCLGVVRKLMRYYICHTKGARLPCRLSLSQISDLSECIINIRSNIPSEFQRKIRHLRDIEHFKASEFRSFLLYFGPFLFKKFL
jgi:hypothetical protein